MYAVYAKIPSQTRFFWKITAFCVFVIMLSNCTQVNQPEIHPVATNTATPVATIDAIHLTLTDTLLPPKPSPSNTIPAKKLATCNPESNFLHLDSSQKLTGTLLFQGEGQLLAIDGATLKQNVLISSLDDIDVFGKSQNGDWLGMVSIGPLSRTTFAITLLSAQGKKIVQTPNLPLPVLDKNAYSWTTFGWIGDRLVTFMFVNSNDEQGARLNTLLDPFTGEWQPSPTNELPGELLARHAEPAISPDLTRALYIQDAQRSNYYAALVLWDLVDHRERWRIKLGEWIIPITWSSDSSSAAFLYQDDQNKKAVYVLDRDGTSVLPVPNLSPEDSFFALAWSPNNRYLAFYAEKPSSPSDSLYQDDIVVYDRITHTSIVACSLKNLENDNLTERIVSDQLIWSPDSQYLIYSNGDDQSKGETKLIVENIITGETRLFKSDNRLFLIGWSHLAPWVTP